MFDRVIPWSALATAGALWVLGSGLAIAQDVGPGAATPSPPSSAETPATTAVDTATSRFIETATSSGLMEAELGRMAERQASDPGVKAFGKAMVRHHAEVSDRLERLATQEGIRPPGAMLPEHQLTVDRLSKLSGKAFDVEYMKLMVEDHANAVHAFETQARTGTDADIRAFADATLPGLREHLGLAQEVVEQQQAGTR